MVAFYRISRLDRNEAYIETGTPESNQPVRD